MKRTMIAVVTIGVVSLTADAATTVVAVPGTPHQTPAIDSFQTTGDEMAGMEVWATFATPAGPVVRTATWTALVAGLSGGAVDAGWFKITESGDTFSSISTTGPWQLYNLNALYSLIGFELYGAPGSTTFDRSPPVPPEGTPGSDVGRDFDVYDKSVNPNPPYLIDYDVTAIYSDILNLTGDPAVGDEYARLTVEFGANTPVAPGTVLSFHQDTDNAAVRGTIVRTPDVASTSMLVGLGLMGLGALRRRLA